MQTTYGSEYGTMFGGENGPKHTFILEEGEIIIGMYVGFATLPYGIFGSQKNFGLCYLRFNTTLRMSEPYNANCPNTMTSYNALSAGLAYFKGTGYWCIEGLTLYYFK